MRGAAKGSAWGRGALAAALALAAVPGAASATAAQALDRRVATAPDGTVRMEFAARPGIWGDGRHIAISRPGDARCRCDPGPVRVDLAVQGGRVRDVESRVGRRPRGASGWVTDLGAVPAAEAAGYLLELARRLPGEEAEDALGAAVLADSAVLWPDLLELARDRERPADVREAAIFWLGQEAGEAAARELESLVYEDDEDLTVRESAIFALSQLPGERAVPALIAVARRRPHPELAREAMFWLGQHDDPRVIAFFEEVLTGR